jgi:hypothetical protein
MISVRTAAILQTHYPAHILLTAGKTLDGKWRSFCYQLRDGSVHTTLLSTTPIFETEQEALQVMKDIVEEAVNTPLL